MRVWSVLLVIVLAGCTSAPVSYHSIREQAKAIQTLDGINEEEATILAQNHIVTKGLADRLHHLKPIAVNKKAIWHKDGEDIEFVKIPSDTFQPEIDRFWEVLFKDRRGSQLLGLYPVKPFFVNVDSQSGEILDWGVKE